MASPLEVDSIVKENNTEGSGIIRAVKQNGYRTVFFPITTLICDPDQVELVANATELIVGAMVNYVLSGKICRYQGKVLAVLDNGQIVATFPPLMKDFPTENLVLAADAAAKQSTTLKIGNPVYGKYMLGSGYVVAVLDNGQIVVSFKSIERTFAPDQVLLDKDAQALVVGAKVESILLDRFFLRKGQVTVFSPHNEKGATVSFTATTRVFDKEDLVRLPRINDVVSLSVSIPSDEGCSSEEIGEVTEILEDGYRKVTFSYIHGDVRVVPPGELVLATEEQKAKWKDAMVDEQAKHAATLEVGLMVYIESSSKSAKIREILGNGKIIVEGCSRHFYPNQLWLVD